jgi:hypothetical protein
MRDYRARQKVGRAVYFVEADTVSLFEALKRSPYPPRDDSPEAIRESLQCTVEFWIGQELQNENAD